MILHMRKIAFLSLLFFLQLLAVDNAYAVANPAAIKWKAAPAPFVTSLYKGVFGRTPTIDDQPHYGNHVASISDPRSKWQLFWHFVRSPEYRQRGLHKAPRVYNVYLRTKNNYNQWFIAKQDNSGARFYRGPFNWGTADAVARFLRAHHWRRR